MTPSCTRKSAIVKSTPDLARCTKGDTSQARMAGAEIGASGARGPHGDREACKPPQRVVVAAPRRASDLDGRNLAGERRQHALALKPRQKLPDADMDAAAEADMAGGASVDIEVVGALPAAWIAVRGAEEHQDLFALAGLDAADMDRAGRSPEEGLDGRLEPHSLLEGCAGQAGIRTQMRELLREARQAINGRAEAADRRVYARRKQGTGDARR